MSIIKSQDLNGIFTHWVPIKYKKEFLKEKFKTNNYHNPVKPNGMWISYNNGWEKWCKDEMPEWINKKDYECFNLKINSNLKIWYINSLNDFMELWNEFKDDNKIRELKEEIKISSSILFSMSTILLLKLKNKGYHFWEWLNKEKQIDGIALTDKGQFDTRMNTFMYGWDCATLFLFDPKDKIEVIETRLLK